MNDPVLSSFSVLCPFINFSYPSSLLPPPFSLSYPLPAYLLPFYLPSSLPCPLPAYSPPVYLAPFQPTSLPAYPPSNLHTFQPTSFQPTSFQPTSFQPNPLSSLPPPPVYSTPFHFTPPLFSLNPPSGLLYFQPTLFLPTPFQPVTAKKVLYLKMFGNRVLNCGKKVLEIKSLCK